jgi:hypothetical protein
MVAKVDTAKSAKLLRLAVRAAHEGDAGSWELWLACAGKAPAKAVASLREEQAFWFAAWCFANGHEALGLVAYERVLASKAKPRGATKGGSTAGPSLNYFRTFVYVLEAMRLGQHERARLAFGPARAMCGAAPSDEVLFAALQFLGGELDRAALQKVVARFARAHNAVAQAARAVALDVLADAAGARQVLATFDSETHFSDFIQKVLRDRFGDAFTEARARPRSPEPKKKPKLPGLVAKLSTKKTPHVFAPGAAAGPPCHGCGHSLRTWFSFELVSVPDLASRLRRWKRLDAHA